MVKKGLKVGATFVDGGITYKVVKVNSDGSYHSARADKASKKEKEAETVDAEVEKTGE